MKINITKKIIIHGDFQGRYHANEINTLSSFDDYDINIIDGNISNAQQISYYKVISDESISFRLSKLENVKINIDDKEGAFPFLDNILEFNVVNNYILNVFYKNMFKITFFIIIINFVKIF